jgi:hypothetical protein
VAFDLAATVPLGVTVKNAAGTAVNATTIALAITLPDGTAVTPAPSVTNPPATTGQYTYDYTAAHQGRHLARWASTNPATAFTDVFYVRSSAPLFLVGLTDLKKYLNIAAAVTDDDEELRDAEACAVDVVEFYAGAQARRTVTAEKHSGRGQAGIVLRQRPLAITSVTENGTAVAADGYHLSDAGVLYRVAGYTDAAWATGRGNISITYQAGAPDQIIRPAVLDSVKELVRINSRPQLGGNYSPFDQGGADDYGTPSGGQMRFGFFVPNVVMQRLQAASTGPTVA